MSLKARIRKIERMLPDEDLTLTELSYHSAEPTEEEMETALKYTDDDPPNKVMFVPRDFKEDLISGKITKRYLWEVDSKDEVFYDGETIFKLVEQYDKDVYYHEYLNAIEMIGSHDFSEIIENMRKRPSQKKFREGKKEAEEFAEMAKKMPDILESIKHGEERLKETEKAFFEAEASLVEAEILLRKKKLQESKNK